VLRKPALRIAKPLAASKMKIQLIIILILLSAISFGQQLKFNGELVDTIFIKSHRSVYQFDDKGTTKGKAQIFSITFNPSINGYLVNQYYQDEYSRTCSPDTIHLKTKNLINKIKKNLNNKDLGNLLTSLVEDVNSNTLINQIDTTSFLNYVTNKQIRKIAKWYKINWYFNRRYSTKEENESFFNSCRSIDTLKTYLNYRFDTQGYTMVTDVSNTINIWISTTDSEYRFEGKYPNPVKQPWYNHSDTSQFIATPILNLEINKSLMEILPNDFLLINTISNEALFDDYITWYFKRRKMIY